jgi:hypothetical protein
MISGSAYLVVVFEFRKLHIRVTGEADTLLVRDREAILDERILRRPQLLRQLGA